MMFKTYDEVISTDPRDAEEEFGDSDEDFDRMYDEYMDRLERQIADEEDE